MVDSYFDSPRWLNALTLAERVTLADVVEFDSKVDLKLAERRLEQWRSQRPFEREDYFRLRLEQEHLTERDFRKWLGLPIECVFLELESILVPAWLSQLRRAFSFQGVSPVTMADITGTNGDGPARMEFLSIARPLVGQALKRFRKGVQKLRRDYSKLPFEEAEIERSALSNLAALLVSRLTRTLVLELNVARLRGALGGKTPERRFRSFCRSLAKSDVALPILQEYAVLARRLVLCVDQWADYSVEVLNRLCADWRAIQGTFPALHSKDKLTRIDGAVGDTHRQGRSVLILGFRSGFQLVYKPHSVGIDLHFGQLLEWLNRQGDHHQFRTPKIVDRKTYGWVEFVPHQPCTSVQELERFYERQGGYLAILYALEATDFHFENLIASGEHPVLIDLEALFHPRIEGADPSLQSQGLALKTMGHSVLRVGLLPQRLWSNAEAEGIEVSGLGGAPGQLTPHRVPIYEGEGTDEMRMVRKRVQLPGAANRPTLNGTEVRVQDHAEALVRGFTRTYGTIMKNRHNLLDEQGLLARFTEDEIRAVLRPTRTYGLLLNESNHPDVLRNALDADRLLDRLWVGVENRPYLTRVIRAEQADLRRGDIPLFTTCPGSRDLWTSDGERIVNFFDEPSLDMARRRVRQLSRDDLSRQVWFIRASLTTLEMGKGHENELWKPYGLAKAARRIDRRAFLRAASAVGDRLEVLALREGEEVSWIGITLLNERDWTLLPLGADLYSGALGVVLFSAYLGAITREERYTKLARAGLATVRRQIEPLLSQPKLASGIGGFTGWGSVIFTWAHLGALWNDHTLVTEAENLADRLPEVIEQDQQLDIIGGAAGCLGALISLYYCAPSERTLSVAAKCGKHLIAQAQMMERGIAWNTIEKEAKKPLTGFSHGAAGVGWALLELSTLTGDPVYRDSAIEAFEYERSVFMPEMGNWPDFRESKDPPNHEGDQTGTAPHSMVAWCHGAPGIGLSRVRALAHLNDETTRTEVTAAIKTTLNYGFGSNHSLCHGDLGNLEFLLEASRTLEDTQLRRQAERIAASIFASIREKGWICGVPLGVETPGLMTGLAGIGYGLLRLAEPDCVPSLLTLSPPLKI